MVKKAPFFYGWIMVGLSVVTMILIYGVRHSFSVFFSPILDEFAWSRGNTAIMLSLNIFFYGLLAPLAGNCTDRWRPRRVMPIGLVILGVATAGCAWGRQLWHFYLLFGILIPLGTAFCGWPVLAPTLMNWFVKKRGLVLGVGQMGGGLSFVYGLFVEFVILRWGWRNTFLVLAANLFFLLLPLHLLFFRYRPQDKGLTAYGAEATPAAAGSRTFATAVADDPAIHWSLSRVLRSPNLWFIVLSYALFWGVAGYMVMAHQIRFMEDAGFSQMFSVSIFALVGIMIFLGQFSGFLSDWWGREKATIFASTLSIGALSIFIFIRSGSPLWLLYLYAVCFGYGSGLFSPTIFASSADIFHGRHFGMVAGLLLFGMGAGGAIGPWLGGYLFDISGSYLYAFILAMVCMALACWSLWVAAPRKAEQLRQQQ